MGLNASCFDWNSYVQVLQTVFVIKVNKGRITFQIEISPLSRHLLGASELVKQSPKLTRRLMIHASRERSRVAREVVCQRFHQQFVKLAVRLFSD